MATPSIDFSDVRIILCFQGYNLDFQTVVREIGFWCNGYSGSIPFNVKLNKKHLDIKNHRTVTFYEEEINGINLTRNFPHALAASDIKPVLRTLYQINNNSPAKYIAVLRDEPLDNFLYMSGLGNFVTYLENLNVLKNSNIILPSNEIFRQYCKKNPDMYQICPIHDRLRTNEIPLCAKAKAEFMANYIKSLNKNQIQQNIISETAKPSLQTFLTEFDVTTFPINAI